LKKKLTYLFFKLDYRDKDKSSRKKLIGILTGYLTVNSLLAMNYFLAFEYMSYAILSFTVNIFLLSFLVLNDFQNLFFAKSQTELLRVLPLKTEDIFLSKMISAFLYLSLITLVCAVPQTIFFYFYEYSIIKSLVFIFENFLFVLSSVILILLIFSVLILRTPRKSNSFIYVFQFMFLVFVMYSSSYATRAKFQSSQTILNSRFTEFLPQKYFALSLDNFWFILISIAVIFVLVLIFYLLLRNNYVKMSDIIFGLEDLKRKKRTFRIFSGFHNITSKIFLGNNLERASYNLVRNQFLHSRTFKIRYVPLTFIPLVFCLIGIFMESQKYLVFSESSENGILNTGFIILTPSIVMTMIMCSRLMVTNTKIADENSDNAEWIYGVLPIDDKKMFLRGVLKFIYINLLLPMIAGSFIILLFKISFLPLFLNLLYMVSAMFFVNSLFLLFDNKYPFSLKASKYNSTSRLIEVFLMALIGAVFFIGQIFIFQNIVFILIAIILIFGASILISKK